MRREEITYSIHNKPLKENAQTPGPGPRHDWTRSRQHLDQVTFYPVDQVRHIGLPVASGALSLDQVQALKSDQVQTPPGPGPPTMQLAATGCNSQRKACSLTLVAATYRYLRQSRCYSHIVTCHLHILPRMLTCSSVRVCTISIGSLHKKSAGE